MRLKRKIEESDSENIFWITMTDLMTGLVLVFIIMFFYAYLTSNVNYLAQQMAKKSANIVLQESLNSQEIKATIDIATGIVKISDLELFELGSYKLSDKGKTYLDKFTPAYFNSIFTNETLSKNVEKIIIQGHTDSQMFAGEFSEDEQYMKNMELSLNRAYEVANYMSKTSYDKVNSEQLRKIIVVEGVGSSEPILTNGVEDFTKSRRVELKLVLKNSNNK